MKVYYAHCKAIYGTIQEKRDIEVLESLGFEVLNPGTDYHTKKSKEYIKRTGFANMGYFIDLVNKCDALAFRALPTMEISTGCYKEIETALNIGIPVIELPCRISKRGLSVEESKEYLKECGYR